MNSVNNEPAPISDPPSVVVCRFGRSSQEEGTKQVPHRASTSRNNAPARPPARSVQEITCHTPRSRNNLACQRKLDHRTVALPFLPSPSPSSVLLPPMGAVLEPFPLPFHLIRPFVGSVAFRHAHFARQIANDEQRKKDFVRRSTRENEQKAIMAPPPKQNRTADGLTANLGLHCSLA